MDKNTYLSKTEGLGKKRSKAEKDKTERAT